MGRNFKRATDNNPDMKAALSARAESSLTAVAKTLAMADKTLISGTDLKYPTNEYFDEFTRSIDGLYEFNALAMKSLATALDNRVSGLHRRLIILSGLLWLATLGAVALAVVFVRSITGPVSEAVAVASAVAEGNLGLAIPVRGTNETGQSPGFPGHHAKQLAAVRGGPARDGAPAQCGSPGPWNAGCNNAGFLRLHGAIDQ